MLPTALREDSPAALFFGLADEIGWNTAWPVAKTLASATSAATNEKPARASAIFQSVVNQTKSQSGGPRLTRGVGGAVRQLLTTSLLMGLILVFGGTARAFDTVVLDPGHGGHDRGASIGYVFEKHLALDTARRVEQLLKQAGLKVVMTRSRDVFIPLPERAAAGNRYGNAIFVSIHYNYNRGGSGNGVETYYHHSAGFSLASYIQAYLAQRTRMTNRGVKTANYHVIRNTTRNPAVLVECGFVSNSTERSRMLTGEFRSRIAEGIAQGIVSYRKVNH